MMARRVVIVARRFWPLAGVAENAIADLAVGLKQAGMFPTVVTPRWQHNWPDEFYFENVRVVRLPKPAGGWWGAWSYARRMCQWLRTNAAEIDVVLAASGNDEAGTLAAALKKTGTPVVSLASPTATRAKQTTGSMLINRKQRADAIVVPHDGDTIALVAMGYRPEQIHTIAPGVAVSLNANRQNRSHSRHALGQVVGDARLGTLDPLAVCLSPLEAEAGLPVLIKAWKRVVGRSPQARLWLFGEGPQRAALFDMIEQLSLQNRVFIPGVLECVDELMTAADLYVAMPQRGSPPHSLLTAMAAGLPVAASATSEHRRVVSHNEDGLLFEPEDEVDCVGAITKLLKQPTLAGVLADNARQRVSERFSLDRRIEQFAELIEQLFIGKHVS